MNLFGKAGKAAAAIRKRVAFFADEGDVSFVDGCLHITIEGAINGVDGGRNSIILIGREIYR